MRVASFARTNIVRFLTLSSLKSVYVLECYVWSYFPANQTCVLNLALNGVKTEHPNVTTAFMVTGTP